MSKTHDPGGGGVEGGVAKIFFQETLRDFFTLFNLQINLHIKSFINIKNNYGALFKNFNCIPLGVNLLNWSEDAVRTPPPPPHPKCDVTVRGFYVPTMCQK